MATESHGEKKKDYLAFFTLQMGYIFIFANLTIFFVIDPSPVLFYFYFFIRSELVRVDPS